MYKRSRSNIDHLIDAITHTKQTMDQLGIVRNADYYANKKSFSATPTSKSPMFSNSRDEYSPKGNFSNNNNNSSRKSHTQRVFFASDVKSSSDDNNHPNPNITLMSNSQINDRWLINFIV